MRNEVVRSNVPKLTICSSTGKNLLRKGILSRLHYHDELEFLPIYEGIFCCQAEGTDYIAKAGEIIFINSRVPHATYTIEPARQGLLQFREKDFVDSEFNEIIKYSLRLRAMSDEPVKIISDQELFAEITEILEESEKQDTAYEYFIRAGIFRILGKLYRLGIIANREKMYYSADVQKISAVLQYINQNYSENITLNWASNFAGFDSSYFCRVFKSATGATFTEYLNFVRICKAESLLGKTTKSISEISETVGFSSLSYFNRIFKKFLNCSPKHYRSARYIAISKGERERHY